MSRLSEVWSLDGSSHATSAPYFAHLASAGPAPPGFDVWFASNIILNRYYAYYLSVTLGTIPYSEIRLRDEGVGVMYNIIRGIDVAFNVIALQRGIPVSKCPAIAADWRDEAVIDYSALHPALSALATESVNRYLEYFSELIHSEGKYHWASLVAPVSISADMFLDSTTTTGGGPAMDEKLAPKASMDNGILQPVRVMREELMRIRGNKEETGWREEEARQVMTRYMKCMDDFVACGFQ